MKDFLKYTFATVVGLVIFCIICTIFMLMSMVGIIASQGQTTNIKDNSILVINLKGEIADHDTPSSEIEVLLGDNAQTLGLDNLTAAIKKAKNNDNIKGIYIESGDVSGSPATLSALRNALKDFRKSKKFIATYADQYSQGAYYVCSVADKVWMNPKGMLSWHGLAAQPQYMRDFLNKVGVKMQVVKVGQYKSATEQYTEDHMSDANREQTTAYITGIWQTMLKDVSESRKISTDSLNAYADAVMEFTSTEDLKKKKLIDATMYADEVKVEMKKLLKIDADDEINQIGLTTIGNVKSNEEDGDDQIAVYYCEGNIVQSPVQSIIMGNGGIVGPDVCKDLEALAKDDDVKAVVIRINSGGGDAYASEQMWHQIKELKKVKPVVVSMGGMAASGGYYMACAANWIVAEPTTLTGSIGIFGTFPDASALMTDKLGFKYDEVKTNKHSSMSLIAQARPFSEDEIALLQKYINSGYSLFRQRVAEGRGMKVDEVEKIAQGHVWLGKDAIAIKLVDQLGSIDDAIAMAAKLAKTNSYYTSSYPGEMDWAEKFLNKSKGGNYLDEQLRLTLGEYYQPFVILRSIREQSPIQARMDFEFRIN